jgi:hypothetical protein
MATSTSTNSFLRTMGGVIGVSIQGAIFNNYLGSKLSPELLVVANGGKESLELSDIVGYKVIAALPPSTSQFVWETYVTGLQYILWTIVPLAGIGFFLAVSVKIQKLGGKKEAPMPVVD